MNLPDYITREEVQRVCKQIGIRDWTQLTEAKVLSAEAAKIQTIVGSEAAEVSTAVFQQALEVELEHGIEFNEANVTNNHPILTGKIVLAHLKEMLDYYERLEVAELEGDLLKAMAAGDFEKGTMKYRQLLAARIELTEAEQAVLS